MNKNIKLFLIVCVIALGFTWLTGANASVKEAAEVSAEKWLNAADNTFSLAANKDKVVVVEFWATWCPPCRASIPHLKEMNKKFADKGVIFVSLTNENDARTEQFCQQNGMDWVIGLGSMSSRDYKVRGIPSAFVIKNGNVLWNGHPMSGLEQAVEQAIAK